MPNISLADIMEMSVPERILLVQDIWDSIAAVPDAVSLTEEESMELDRRLEEYRKDPLSGSPWEEVRERIRAHKGAS